MRFLVIFCWYETELKLGCNGCFDVFCKTNKPQLIYEESERH
jgi:hypothetical protein